MMAKFKINPDKETTIADELIERDALGFLFEQVMGALEAKKAYEEAQKKERRES